MLLEDQVVHAQVFKVGLHRGTSDFIIQVTTHDDLVSNLGPFLDFRLEVFEEGVWGVPVIIIVIEVGLVLGPCRSLSTGTVARSIHTHHSKNHAILSSVPVPSPPAKLGFVTASAHGKVADLVMG